MIFLSLAKTTRGERGSAQPMTVRWGFCVLTETLFFPSAFTFLTLLSCLRHNSSGRNSDFLPLVSKAA